MKDGATEAAQVLATMVSRKAAWPEEAARDLARLLGHSLAAPSRAQRRHVRLGLLIELVSTNTGEFVDVETYETARKQKAADGADWPTASGLSRTYGHWLAAVRAAMRFWFDGGGAHVAADHSDGPARPYKPAEVIDALNTARKDLRCDVVTEWEYEEWRALRRASARRGGQPLPRYPSTTAIRRRFGSFDRALEQAATAPACRGLSQAALV